MFSTSRGLDSFDQYLQDVEKYPLISNAAEERALARRAREGDKEAAERLVTANLRFVISYVKKYQAFPDDLPRLRLLLDKAYEHILLRDRDADREKLEPSATKPADAVAE